MDEFAAKLKRLLESTEPNIRVIEYVADAGASPIHEPTANEMADYDAGFRAREEGNMADDTQTPAWQRGWAEARK